MDIRYVLADIVRNMPTDQIPISYITMLKIKRVGIWNIFTDPKQIDSFFENPLEYHDAEDVRVVFDSEAIMVDIAAKLQAIYDDIDSRLEI